MKIKPPSCIVGFNANRNFDPELIERRAEWIIEARKSGAKNNHIAEALSVSVSTVEGVVRMAKTEGRLPEYASKISADDMARRHELIMTRVDSGATAAQIAQELGVHYETARRFIREAKAAIAPGAPAVVRVESVKAAVIVPGKTVIVFKDGSRVSLPCFPGEETEIRK